MTSFKQNKIVPYAPQLLFDIVLNVEEYPQFLPWCQAVRTISKGQNQLVAEMVVQFKSFIEQYQSQINYQLTNDRYVIQVEAISGPFKYLHNEWLFYRMNEETIIDFSIDFQFKSVLLDKIIGLFFYQALEKMVGAFEHRASFLSNTASEHILS